MRESIMRARPKQSVEYTAPRGSKRKNPLRSIESGGSSKNGYPVASTDDRELFKELDEQAEPKWAAMMSKQKPAASDKAKYEKIIDAVLIESPELDPKEAVRREKRDADIAKSMAEIRANREKDDEIKRGEIKKKFGL